MSRKKIAPRQLHALCGRVHEDDGVHPSILFGGKDKVARGRKSHQLGAQVREALHYALGGECDDPVLCGLFIASVEPAPGANRLIVTVEVPPSDHGPAPIEVLEHLGRASGWLRTAAAAAVCRRKMPELEFRIAPPGEDAP